MAIEPTMYGWERRSSHCMNETRGRSFVVLRRSGRSVGSSADTTVTREEVVMHCISQTHGAKQPTGTATRTHPKGDRRTWPERSPARRGAAGRVDSAPGVSC